MQSILDGMSRDTRAAITGSQIVGRTLRVINDARAGGYVLSGLVGQRWTTMLSQASLAWGMGIGGSRPRYCVARTWDGFGGRPPDAVWLTMSLRISRVVVRILFWNLGRVFLDLPLGRLTYSGWFGGGGIAR